MCGRFLLQTDPVTLGERFGVALPEELAPRYNIAPGQPVLVIVHDGTRRRAGFVRWGLVPPWAKAPTARHQLINARVETAAHKPAFRRAFRKRRCLIVADGYYEWATANGRKQPFCVRRRDGRPFAFAGLWERWEGEGGLVYTGCAILTTQANALTAPIHPRMPVILPPDAEELWLNRDVTDAARLQRLLGPYPSEELVCYPVSARVNNARYDAPDCVEPLDEAEPSNADQL
ncbi:MAG: SOS response-associated peptidase [Calditerricola sp.]|nr:SOS response-associated peptidase [Calditerricola sp.]